MDQLLPDYWESRDLYEAMTTTRFLGLTEIALRVLKQMRERRPNKPIVMICGPITSGGLGSEVLNTARFATAVQILKVNGHSVFDQLPFETHMKRLLQTCPPEHLLEHFYGSIFDSYYIKRAYFLPLWRSSIGSRWERKRLAELCIPMVNFPKDFLVRVENGRELFPTALSLA